MKIHRRDHFGSRARRCGGSVVAGFCVRCNAHYWQGRLGAGLCHLDACQRVTYPCGVCGSHAIRHGECLDCRIEFEARIRSREDWQRARLESGRWPS